MTAQSMSFVLACALGVALGALYDLFRISRIAIRTPTAIMMIEDILYFFLCAIITFVYMLTVVEGQVRFFVVIGEMIGASLYYFTVGRVVMALSHAIIGAVKQALRAVYRVTLLPVLRLVLFVGDQFKISSKKVHRNMQKYGARTKYRLKRRSLLLYNLLKAELRAKKRPKSSGPER